MSVSVIIPALNEEECIGQVLSEIPAELVNEIIVVDGGSTDHTVASAKAAGARVIHEPRRGYGRACATGLAAADGDIVIYLDADGADNPAYIPHLLDPITIGQAELVLGSRLASKTAAGTMFGHQRFGNWLSAKLIHLLYGLPLTDLGTFRAVRRQPLLALEMQEMTYGWPTEMIVKATRHNWRVMEVPVRHRARLGGHSKISGTVRGTVLATYFILSTILRYTVRPLD